MNVREVCSGTELLSTGSPLKSSTAKEISALNDYHHSVAVDVYHNDDQTKELGQASVFCIIRYGRKWKRINVNKCKNNTKADTK